jgi:hypothetical protein
VVQTDNAAEPYLARRREVHPQRPEAPPARAGPLLPAPHLVTARCCLHTLGVRELEAAAAALTASCSSHSPGSCWASAARAGTLKERALRAAMVAKVGGVFGALRHPHLIQPYLAYYDHLASHYAGGPWCSPIPWWCD